MLKIIVKRRKDGRILTVSFVFLFIILWILIGFNFKNPDYEYYENLFSRATQGVSYHAVETGFWYIVKFAAKIGVSYSLFLKIYTLIALLLISSSIIKYTEKPSLVLVLYMCYPFLLDVAQIRHFMAISIFTFSVRYLESYSKKNLIKYIFLIVIAASQQIMAIAFLAYLLVYLIDQKKAAKIAIMLTIINMFGCKYILQTSLVQKIFSLRDKTVDYASGYSNSQLFMYACFYGILIILCVFLQKINNVDKTNRSFLYKICMYSTLFIPFLMIDFQYTRLFRGSILVIYIFITQQIYSLKKSDKLIVTIGLLFIMILVAIKLFGKGSGYFETLTMPIFQNNEILYFLFN